MESLKELLDTWEPSDCTTEDDYTNDLYDDLECYTDFEVEIYPNTRFGRPDILVEDILVIELKVNPSKAERDGLIGQCSGYSREWATWAVIVDSPESTIGDLERLLEDKGLERIWVWLFS